jgi:hypothetical protein
MNNFDLTKYLAEGKLLKEIKPRVEYNSNNEEYELYYPEGVIDGFLDEDTRYRLKHYPDPSQTIIFSDTIVGGKHYNTTIDILDKYNIPYKLRKARTDNSVRIMMDITSVVK